MNRAERIVPLKAAPLLRCGAARAGARPPERAGKGVSPA